MTDIVGFAGSLNTPSRTRALVDKATQRSADLSGGKGTVFDLTDLGSRFGAVHDLAELDPQPRAVVSRIVEADALVIGSPVYKGSYTGLFKHLFDLIEPDALKGKPVLLTATGGGHRHALVIEHQLRPLLGFFEAAVVATGIYACSEDFTDGVLASPAVAARLDIAAAQLASAIAERAPARQHEFAISAA
ncbi:NAD(P)H-dependent oxidoreductase [Paracoccus alkanivorans]|uniref:FMN reductase n=1 Tax=Paracoccus alkanivorans TaxID=2116655 RepID=A0A3M0MQD9_9RHOB|nr:NAD(P)H-dependent oxidoreductase [Paracoccus alkanivorans]RMC37930.1 FMN reductase [Paracoccus alkanivorans]